MRMRFPEMMKPLLVEEYCRFRCHGSEKLGSECTQNTCAHAMPLRLHSNAALSCILVKRRYASRKDNQQQQSLVCRASRCAWAAQSSDWASHTPSCMQDALIWTRYPLHAGLQQKPQCLRGGRALTMDSMSRSASLAERSTAFMTAENPLWQ